MPPPPPSPALPPSSVPAASPRPSFREACHFWFKLGCISFGGPAGQIAIMQTELVDRRRWIDSPRFLHALNFCMLLPGPEAQQLATYCGWLLHGVRGGIVAGALFVLPAALLLWGLGVLYVTLGEVAVVAGIFTALQPAVLAIVVSALWKLGRRALRQPTQWLLAAASFAALAFFAVPFPAVVAGAAVLGALFLHRTDETATASDSRSTPPPFGPHLLRVLGVGLPLWFAPVFVAAWGLGSQHTLVHEGWFFTKAALVTFGGAYAVLPYVAQQAVEHFSWLTPAQMLDGLGLAETTPGPLVLVLQFVGFMGGYQHPGDLPPLLAATLGAGITVWTTFVPCFLWIFLGAPYLERLRGIARLNGALTAVTAAVVGVILNLAVWFAGPVLFPERALDGVALAIAATALVALLRFKIDLLWIVLGAASFGAGRALFA